MSCCACAEQKCTKGRSRNMKKAIFRALTLDVSKIGLVKSGDGDLK